MKSTINDVARLSGYSKTSVSFAFNDPSRISQSAKDRILAAAEELGYYPDPAARHLSMQRIGSIGFLTPHGVEQSFLNPYIVEVFRGVSSAMQLEDLSVTVISMEQDIIVEAIQNAAVGGFISLGLTPEKSVHEMILRRKIPFVTVDASPLEGVSSVNIRDRKAASDQLELVLRAGHRSIGIIAFELPDPTDEAAASDIFLQRTIGYNLALEAAGLPELDSGDVYMEYAPATIEGGYTAANKLFTAHPDITAMVLMSDSATAGVYLACRELNYAIPEDISIIGFDDIPANRALRPDLTTVSQPGFRKGQTAARVLLEKIASPETYIHRRLSYEIRSGSSLRTLRPGESVGKIRA